MRDLYISVGIFSFAIVLVLAIQIQNLPPKPSPSVQIDRERDDLIVGYLFLKSDLMKDSMMAGFLEKEEAKAQEKEHLRDLLALLLGLEGEKERSQKMLATLPEGPQKDILRFCFDLSEDLPITWEDTYPEGWVKAKLASMIYLRENDDAHYAESLVSIREYENLTHRFARINVGFQFLGFMGFIFLMGMIFSKRYLKMLGKPFFQLSPLYLSSSRLLRFSGLIMIGFVLSGSIAQSLFGGVQGIWAVLVGYLSFIGLSLLFVKRIFFEPEQHKVLQILQLDNLKMRLVYIWQIFRSVAILVALCLAALALSQWLGWPLDRFQLNTYYQNLLQDPVSTGLLFAMGCILAPIFEEIIFRGMIQRAMLSFGKPIWAIFASALIFTIIHPMAQWPTTFAIGVGLALVYQRTGNLLVNIWAHAAWNGMVLWLLSQGVFL